MFAGNKVSPTLQAAYDEQYSDESTPWRELCARYKADNIRAVCSGERFTRVLECGAGRSEERRVGKECRSRRAPAESEQEQLRYGRRGERAGDQRREVGG